MSDYKIVCPQCNRENIIKNGTTHHKKPKYMCKDCSRKFILNPAKKYISNETKQLINKLLLVVCQRHNEG